MYANINAFITADGKVIWGTVDWGRMEGGNITHYPAGVGKGRTVPH